jgi:hypothetical protein
MSPLAFDLRAGKTQTHRQTTRVCAAGERGQEPGDSQSWYPEIPIEAAVG